MGKTLTIYLLSLLMTTSLFSQSLSVYKNQKGFPGGESPSPGPLTARRVLPPAQSHVATPVYSLEIGEHARINQYLKSYLSPQGREWLKKVLKKAQTYKGFIESKIEYYHMPPELLFLPIIESTYESHAISRSGAVGLWQFMANSINPYAIRIDKWLDERKDFWKSTEGSLQKLAYNHQVLNDWLLALAAYNCGLGRMTRIIKSTGIHDYWKLADQGFLPAETTEYVPKFIAVATICFYPGRYGLYEEWGKPLQWQQIPLNQAVDLGVLAEKAGIPLDLLKTGNAELRYGITPPPESGYRLKVPKQYADKVRQVLKDSRMKLMRFYLYRISSGDTLYALSRHYGIPVAMIKRYNPTLSATNLKIGKEILIPSVKIVAPYKRPRKPVTDISNYNAAYTVKKGDSLWSIAKLFTTTPEELALANKLDINSIIKEGRVLKVPANREMTKNEKPDGV